MPDNYNNILNEARKTNDAINTEQNLKGSVDPLLEAKFQKLERRLMEIESKTVNGSEVSYNSIDVEQKNAFIKYLRSGDESALSKISSVQVNDAGFIVSQTLESLIAQNIGALSVMRNIASVTKVSSDSLDLAIEDNGSKASWGEPVGTTTVTKRYIKAYDIVAQPKITAKLLEDGEINVEEYVTKKIGESFARAEDESFLTGDGVSKPKGILTFENGINQNQISQISGDISFPTIMNLQSALDGFYSSNVAYLMHKNTESQIRFLKDTNDHYIWRPAQKKGEQNTILGVPVYTTNYMPYGSGQKSIVYGNFERGYQIVERAGVNLLRDPFTEKPFIKFYTLRRVGGDLIDGRALKILLQQ